MTIEQAYAAAETVTRTEARNFYYGIRLLPVRKRHGLCALYALARRIDDIGDGNAPLEHKRAALAKVRKQLSDIDSATDPVLVAVAETARRFPVPLEAFDELIDGVEMDLADTSYETFDDLRVYCRCVAGSIGRLCLSIFGNGTDPRAPLFADQLGIALQQTNILRDIREDLLLGRIYLPREELADFGVRLQLDDAGTLHDPDARLASYIEFAAQRAQHWYELGLRLLPELDHRSAACCAAMSGIYHHLLVRIQQNPTVVYERRMSLPAHEKGRVALVALTRAVLPG
ncbi:presqualene diphosphate synthase HpnD [Flexivirga caeni]|uniref:Squalene synthase HpnD n=1 Tax=Flexivirga caeni TaxID=2294115 RepID=A0A3M9M256_9MICO|nr:presqualene diphosphate synthase HpnD [Flexivirga caeni]RNI19634.1 squalene synthase HpnD [Flexivirga caeni]